MSCQGRLPYIFLNISIVLAKIDDLSRSTYCFLRANSFQMQCIVDTYAPDKYGFDYSHPARSANARSSLVRIHQNFTYTLSSSLSEKAYVILF